MIYCSFSFLFLFFLDKKLKKPAVALKFLNLLTVLSLNSDLFYQCFLLVLFACKEDLSPFYKSSKRRNHLKPENLEIPFLLSALKMPMKSVTSYETEIKYLQEANSPLIFRFCNCIFTFQLSNLFLFHCWE